MAEVGRRRLPSTTLRQHSQEYKLTTTKLPWDKLSKWIHCICVVTFDLELGQIIEAIYPDLGRLTDKEKNNICYLSFPDSNSGCLGDTQFFFRIRMCTMRRCMSTANIRRGSIVEQHHGKGHLYGFPYFRQVKDKSVRRGYLQKSVVIISRHPFYNLFSHLVSLIAPEFFDTSVSVLESVCHDLDRWPSPEPGAQLQLPVMGSVIQLQMSSGKSQLNGVVSAPCLVTLSSPNHVDLVWPLLPLLPLLHSLWELILLGQPLAIFATHPKTVSSIVVALVSMIDPLEYPGDYRPYFTIHDSEFRELSSCEGPVVLGLTNPFFSKMLQSWSNVVTLGPSAIFPPSPLKLKRPTPGMKPSNRLKPGVHMQHKPFLKNDKTLLQFIEKGVAKQRPPEVQDAILRKHFFELTNSFIIPLEAYLATLMPLQKSISPFRQPPTLRSFDEAEFLRSISQTGPQITSGVKGDWTGLYKAFFSSPTFANWLETRSLEINHHLKEKHLEAIINADLLSWLHDKEEVEIVDLILKLRETADSMRFSKYLAKPDLVVLLDMQMEGVINTLPHDMQSVFYSNC